MATAKDIETQTPAALAENTVVDEDGEPRRSPLLHDRRAATRSTRSSGRRATPSSPARTSRSSSRRTSSSRSSGRRPRRTSSRRSTSAAACPRPSASAPCKQMIGRVVDTIGRVGPRGRLLRERGGGRDLRGRAEGDPRQPARRLQLAGLVQRRLRGEAAVLSAASSSRSRTRWTRSSTGSGARASSSAAAPARASTSRSCAPRRSSSRRAATPPARSRSCAAPTRRPGRSSRAARRGARRRWSCSTSTTPTSRSSSGARRTRRRRRACSRRPATTCRSTRPTGRRSSTRTPTTRCASPTPSWRRPRTTRDWNLTARTDGTVVETVKARELLHQIAEAAWQCADPGVQYDTTINGWHTLPNTGRINASNPCSEYMSIDDSACNLASLNLMKFRREDGELDVEAFEHAVDVMFLAQEILVGNSSYPTPEIERNAKAYRQLGLGYANLGALLMARGLPYDSDEGRAYAAAITALMTGRAYRKSAEIAARMGPFAGYQPNAARDDRRDRQAPRGGREHRATPTTMPADLLGRRAPGVGRRAQPRRGARLPQRAGDRARADRDDQLHDGLRHDRRRARLLARQVEEARRRRRDHDREQDRADGAREARLRAGRGRARSSPTSTSATRSSARRT